MSIAFNNRTIRNGDKPMIKRLIYLFGTTAVVTLFRYFYGKSKNLPQALKATLIAIYLFLFPLGANALDKATGFQRQVGQQTKPNMERPGKVPPALQGSRKSQGQAGQSGSRRKPGGGPRKSGQGGQGGGGQPGGNSNHDDLPALKKPESVQKTQERSDYIQDKFKKYKQSKVDNQQCDEESKPDNQSDEFDNIGVKTFPDLSHRKLTFAITNKTAKDCWKDILEDTKLKPGVSKALRTISQEGIPTKNKWPREPFEGHKGVMEFKPTPKIRILIKKTAKNQPNEIIAICDKADLNLLDRNLP